MDFAIKKGACHSLYFLQDKCYYNVMNEPFFKEKPKNEVEDFMDAFAKRLSKLRVLPEADFRPEYERIAKNFGEGMRREFPDRQEEISAYLGLPDFLWKCASIRDIQESTEEKKRFDPKLIQDLAEYQFLLTHFLSNNQDRESMERFWNFFEKIGDTTDTKEVLDILKIGLLGQVATEHLFLSSGINVKSATPKEDSYYKVDLWIADPNALTALQTKTSPDIKELRIFGEQDWISFPVLTPEEVRQVKDIYFFENFFRNMNTFRVRTKQYSEEIKKPIEAYMVVLPGKEIDQVTGEPSEILKKQFEKEIKKIITIKPSEVLLQPIAKEPLRAPQPVIKRQAENQDRVFKYSRPKPVEESGGFEYRRPESRMESGEKFKYTRPKPKK